jgi:S1-C subfamily serine protease
VAHSLLGFLVHRAMKRATLYSTAHSRKSGGEALLPKTEKPAAKPSLSRRSRIAAWLRARERPLYLCAGALLVFGALATHAVLAPPPKALTEKEVQAAIQKTLDNRPSTATAAYEAVRGSVVMVRGLGTDAIDGEYQKSVGSGVVVVDSGVILTNLHVVTSADYLQIVFADGTESEAEVVAVRADQDLAVLKASTLPDDLQAATLGSANDLQPGDDVVAVGFPFGIGPSVSSGVVSGLKRVHRSAEGGAQLANLIQFDAAANPGNSGGPLVNGKGEVVGIVTGILNPTEQRVFIGIGFAVPIETAAAAAGQSPF